ncbi:MAG TPA: biopolymer transporter ExbD [Anaeromyxobacteraceae bacterium]|nr:biopolymer transporter ExbD [Anaeromyxobacteraceae bacterium]
MTSPAKPEPTYEQLAEEKSARNYRRAKRKARAAEGEVSELNITAMMDMMTIILVFLLKSYQTSTVNVTMTADLTVPVSSTQLSPQDNIGLSVSMREILVGERRVVEIQNGIIPPAAKGGKADSFYVGAVYDALKKEVDKQKYIAQFNKAAPFTGRVNIVADKRVPYRTLMEVLYTAGQAELGEYKFMVMKND